MSNWKEDYKNLMLRIDGDLEIVDAFIGMTPAEIRIRKGQEFISNLRLSDRDELIKKIKRCGTENEDGLVLLIQDYYNK